jgi:hypothetical protein
MKHMFQDEPSWDIYVRVSSVVIHGALDESMGTMRLVKPVGGRGISTQIGVKGVCGGWWVQVGVVLGVDEYAYSYGGWWVLMCVMAGGCRCVW